MMGQSLCVGLCGLLGGKQALTGQGSVWVLWAAEALECPYNDFVVVLRARLQHLQFLKTACFFNETQPSGICFNRFRFFTVLIA